MDPVCGMSLHGGEREKGGACLFLCFKTGLRTNSFILCYWLEPLLQARRGLGDGRVQRKGPSLPSGGVRPSTAPST